MGWVQKVPFRLLLMPCCSHQLCWVNPRLPNYCPECGRNVMARIKACVIYNEGVWLKSEGDGEVQFKEDGK